MIDIIGKIIGKAIGFVVWLIFALGQLIISAIEWLAKVLN